MRSDIARWGRVALFIIVDDLIFERSVKRTKLMLLVFSGMSALETPSERAGGNHTLRVGPQVPRQVQIARATGKPLKPQFTAVASSPRKLPPCPAGSGLVGRAQGGRLQALRGKSCGSSGTEKEED
jgi:hypothetical protein